MKIMVFFRHLLCLFIPALAGLWFTSCNPRIKEEKEWGRFFDAQGVTGSFEIVDNNKETVKFYNKELGNTRLAPMETFDIFNALTALETATAPDEQYVFTDSATGKKQTLANAFQTYDTDFFKFLARKTSDESIRHYLDTIKYGNMQTGHKPGFWMDGTLKITPDEQVGFMERLYHNELGFADRTGRIVLEMMLQEKATDYKLYYRMGFAPAKNGYQVWTIGLAETIHRLKNPKTNQIEPIPHAYYFALTFRTVQGDKDKAKAVAVTLLHQLLTENAIHSY